MNLLDYRPPGLEGLLGYLKEYPGRVKEEFMEGASQIRPGVNQMLPAMQMAYSAFTPAIEDIALQGGNLLAPGLNQLAQGQYEAQQALAQQLGLPDSGLLAERQDITGEQLATPLLLAGSLARGKFPNWMSPSQRAITAAQPKATGQQYAKALEKEKGAVAEAKQTGLLAALQDTPGTITQEQALSLVSPLDLTETVRGVRGIEGRDYDWWRRRTEELFYADSPEEYQQAVANRDRLQDTGLPTKYGDDENLNLPGGTNPKEILVQLPFPKLADVDSREAYDAAIGEQDLRGGVYTGGHWSEPNVLTHIRTNERDVGGKKALHAEEYQSDWHQQATGERTKKIKRLAHESEISREEAQKLVPSDWGYHKQVSQSEVENARRERDRLKDALDKKQTELLVAIKKDAEPYILSGREINDKLFQNSEWRELGEQTSQASKNLNSLIRRNAKAVPDAPFKKTWHELGWKRHFMEAIRDPSIGRLTWTTGDVQADRYDLSRFITEIKVKPTKTWYDNWDLFIKYKEGTTGLGGVTEEHLPRVGESDEYGNLSDWVGKEMADKIENDADGSLKTYSGLDLEMGGEFHKNLYDKKIPQFVKKFLKQFGVEPQLIRSPRFPGGQVTKADWSGSWGIMDADGMLDTANTWKTREEAEEALNQEYWYIDITPEMREHFSEQGIPLTMIDQPKTGLLAYA